MEKQIDERVTQQEVKMWVASLGVNTPLDSWYLSHRAMIKDIFVDYIDERKHIFDLENLMAEVRDRLLKEIGEFSYLKGVYYDWRGIVFDTPDAHMKAAYRDLWDREAHFGVCPEKQAERDRSKEMDEKANQHFKEKL